MNLTEDYVSFETAKLLKKKRFNEPCRGNYYWGFDDKDNSIVEFGEWTAQAYNNDFEDEAFICSAPTLQMAMKWLRRNHNLFIQPLAGVTGGKWWYDFDIIPVNRRDIKWNYYTEMPVVEYGSPEEAIEAAIKYCLENLV